MHSVLFNLRGRYWRRLGKALIICLSCTLILSGCFLDNEDNSTLETADSEQSTVGAIPAENGQTLNLLVRNSVGLASVAGLEVRPLFQLTEQSTDLVLSVKDVDGEEVAGYRNGSAFVNRTLQVPDSGIVPLQLEASNYNPASSAGIRLSLVVSGDGYFSSATHIDLYDSEVLDQHLIEMLPKSVSASAPTSFAQQPVTVDGSSRVTQQVIVSTPIVDASSLSGRILDGATASITIPANTQLFDANGDSFTPSGSLTASVMFISADPKNLAEPMDSPLFLFPGGLQIDGLVGDTPADLTNDSSFSFISAGFAAIEITDEAGNKVSNFSQGGITLTFEVPASTVNPSTGQPIKLSDSTIPLWSYNENTARWSYEGNADIIAENSSTFTVRQQITHLSYYNLDWYGSDRCKLVMKVVDSNNETNINGLSFFFNRTSGGWAFKRNSSGRRSDQLSFNRLPAFAGTFGINNSSGNNILASLEVDGQTYSVANGESGVTLADFCFGARNNSVKNVTAKLNVANPPTISITPELELVCPTDSTATTPITSGYYSLREGYSYLEGGSLSSNSVTLNQLIEGSEYRFYYSGNGTRGETTFTANTSVNKLQIESLAPCQSVTQTLHVRAVCLDDTQAVVKQLPLENADYWLRSTNYGYNTSGSTSSNGNASLDSIVDGQQYRVYAYDTVLSTRTWPWGSYRYRVSGSTTFTGAADSTATVDITRPSDDAFCVNDGAIDYAQTTISAARENGLANGSDAVSITVQEKDQYGNNRTSNSGTLTLTSNPSDGVVLGTIVSNSDGTYTSSVTSSVAASVTISGAIDDNAISNSATINFAQQLELSNTEISASSVSVAADGTSEVTITAVLKDSLGNVYTPPAGDLTFTLPDGVTQKSASVVDGTYTFVYTSTHSGTVSFAATLGEQSTGASVDVTFTPVVSIAQSTFAVSASEVNADGVASVTATVSLKDYAGNAFAGEIGLVNFTNTGTATISAVSAGGSGVYFVTLTSTTANTVQVSATYNGVSISAAQSTDVLFVSALDLSQSTFAVSASEVNADGTTSVTATVTLKDYEGKAFVGESNLVSFTNTGIATMSAVSAGGSGVYTVTLTSTTANTVQVSATYNGNSVGAAQTVEFLAVQPQLDANASTVTVNTNATKVGNEITVTVTLKDDASAAYTDATNVVISGSGVTIGSVTDAGGGIYSATLSATETVTSTITVTVDGTALPAQPEVTFTEYASASSIPNQINAGSEVQRFDLVLFDTLGARIGHDDYNVSIAPRNSAFDTLVNLSAVFDDANDDYDITVGCVVTGFAITVDIRIDDNILVGTFEQDCN